MRNYYKLRGRVRYYAAWGVTAVLLLFCTTLSTYAFGGEDVGIEDILRQNKNATTTGVNEDDILKKVVTIDVKGVSFVAFFNQLKAKSGTEIFLSYNAEDIKRLGVITINEKGMTIGTLLTKVLSPAGLTYSIKGNIISVKKKEQPQKKSIKGRVISLETNKPITGAMVMIEGTQLGAIADDKGDFILQSPNASGTVEITCVGYVTQKIKFSGDAPIHVKMKQDVMKVDEVTVVAYGTQKSRNVLGAITSVKAKDLEDIPSASFTNLMQGHMAGVEVNNVSGSPGGGGTKVQIRGYNSLMDGGTDGSPLYVIDGVPISSFTSPITGTNTLAEIDPATIESIEVLKDAASAAIYGSRASNGVILITTKKGKVGKGKFSANFSQSYTIFPESPTQVAGNDERYLHILAGRAQRQAYSSGGGNYFLANSYEESYGKSGGIYDYFWNSGTPNAQVDYMLQDSLNPFYNNATNWWKYCFKPGIITNANVQTSGGSDLVQYLVGAGFYNEKGIMVGSDFQRINLISNLNIQPRKNLKFDARIYLAYTDRSKGAASTSFSSGRDIEGLTVDPKSNSTLLPGTGDIEKETLKRINETLEKNTSMRLRASLGGTYTLLNCLNLSSNIAIDYTGAKKNAFAPSYLDAMYKFSISTGGVGSSTVLTNENIINFNKSFNETHNVDILAGHSLMRNASDEMEGYGKNGPSDKVHYVVEGFPNLMDVNGRTMAMKDYKSNFNESVMISYFGRASYNYKQKYLAEFTVRRDGSSVFGENVRWATFPSAALGWAFSEEKFMKNFFWLDFAKVRASWGQSGQTFKDPYLAHGLISIGKTFLGNPGMGPQELYNPNLSWETTDQYDLGLDFIMLEQRLRLKFDYYYKYSKSLLWNIPLPGNVYGHKLAMQNVMEISNQGFEFEGTFDVLRNSAVKWRTKFNFSTNSNRFEKSYTNMDMMSGNGILVLGRSIHSFYLYKDKGLIQSQDDIKVYYDQFGNATPLYNISKSTPFRPGMRMIEDINMDGRINQEDRVYAASTLPIGYGGWANEIKWKGFDLNILFTYTLGRNIISNYSDNSLKFEKNRWDPVFADYSNSTFWEKPGDMADYPIMQGGAIGQFDANYDSKIEKISYVRLKQLTLSYNLPKKVMSKIGIEGIKLFFTAENLFLLTNYSGIDPEVVPMETGYDNFSNYPLARKMTLGITVNF